MRFITPPAKHNFALGVNYPAQRWWLFTPARLVAFAPAVTYQRYFPDGSVSKEVAVGIRAAFIEHVPLDMRRLAPEDSFGRELQLVWSHDSLADVELILDVEKRFDVSISHQECRETLTMGALIRLVDRKVKEKKPIQAAEATRGK